MKMRKATLNDSSAIVKLSEELGYPSTESQMIVRLGPILNDPHHVLFVAEKTIEQNPDGVAQVVGWIHAYGRYSMISDYAGEIGALVVDARFRGQGIGKKLIATTEDWCKSQGLKLVRFSSRVTREDAHRLYFSLGYNITKTSHYFVKNLE